MPPPSSTSAPSVPSFLKDVLGRIGDALGSMSESAQKITSSAGSIQAFQQFQKSSQSAMDSTLAGKIADSTKVAFKALVDAFRPQAQQSAGQSGGAASSPQSILNVSVLKLNLTIEKLIATMTNTAIPLAQARVVPPRANPVADTSIGAMFKNIGTAVSAMVKSADLAARSVFRFTAEMVGMAGAVAFTIDKLAGLPLQVLQRAIASVGNEIASFVRLANPGVFQRFQRAIDDLYASIGIALAPLLEKLTQVFRTIGSAIFSLSANGQGALRVLAAISVSFVTLGVVIAGVTTAAVTGAIALKFFAAAVALVEAIASGGTLVPVMIAVGAGMEAIGTAGATLGGVLAGIAAVAVTVTAVLEDLTPVLDIFADTFMSFMDTLGQAFKSLTQGGLLTALATMFSQAAQSIGGFIKQLAPAFGVLVSVATKLLPVFSTIVSIIGQIVATPFILIGKAIQAAGPFLEAFAEAFATVFSEVGNVVFDLVKVFAEFIAEVVIFNPVVMLIIGALKELGIVMAGFALAVADAVKAAVGWIRLLFGIDTPVNPAKPAKPTDNTNAAVTSVSTGDPRDALRKAREAAFQLGTGAAKPEEVTAKNTGEIAKAIQDMRANIGVSLDKIVNGVQNFPNDVKQFVVEVANEFVKGVTDALPKNPFTSGGAPSVGSSAAAAVNPLGPAILRQLDRLNPFS